MTVGSKQLAPIPANILWDDYYENLHSAYNNMRGAYSNSGLTQDGIACLLNVDKSLISKRLNGTENLTLKSMSFTATATGCRLLVAFIPYQYVGTSNYFAPTPRHINASTTSSNSGIVVFGTDFPIPAAKSKKLEPA